MFVNLQDAVSHLNSSPRISPKLDEKHFEIHTTKKYWKMYLHVNIKNITCNYDLKCIKWNKS